MAEFPGEKSESMTAVGMLCRIFSGHTLQDDPLISKGAELLVRTPPKWETGGDIDYYYWYYADAGDAPGRRPALGTAGTKP
jgi:hypothetical protein